MQSLSGHPGSEAEAHSRRVAHLTRRLTARAPLAAERAFELCEDFDAAAEFAACEGRSIQEGISEFLLDGVELDGVGQGSESLALAGIAGFFSPAFHPDTELLPVMPAAVSRLLRISEDATSTLELEKIAVSDPVLSARLLGAANSAQFGSRFEIIRLREAILRVGVPEARRIGIACCLAGLFASRTLTELWEHSQGVADIMLNLAGVCGIDAETAYLTGLLHDIGRLGLTVFPADRRAQEESWLGAGFPRVYAETLAYGIDHSRLGAEILRGWDLPERIVDAVALHHRPGRFVSILTATLYLAEDLSAQDAGASAEDLWPGMWRRAACEKVGISLDYLRCSSADVACA
jgi:putative nucleotidyltransferase with HDIG domain